MRRIYEKSVQSFGNMIPGEWRALLRVNVNLKCRQELSNLHRRSSGQQEITYII